MYIQLCELKVNRILLLALYRSQRNISKEQKGKTGHSIDWQRK